MKQRQIQCDSHIRPWAPHPWVDGPFDTNDEIRDAISTHLLKCAGIVQLPNGSERLKFTCNVTIMWA